MSCMPIIVLSILASNHSVSFDIYLTRGLIVAKGIGKVIFQMIGGNLIREKKKILRLRLDVCNP